MTRIRIDEDLCQGSRECVALVPDLVTFDAVGVAQVVAGAPEISADVALRLVAICPSMAISVADD